MSYGSDYESLADKIIWSRYAQLVINECLKSKMFDIPVHLALGHEAFSEAVAAAMGAGDKLLCSHRNLHYQFARGASLENVLKEFQLSGEGLAKGRAGSMNLTNPAGAIVYTSSILGNNLCVAAGVALSKRVRREDAVVFVVTGDGAMEEGAFYETLVNARSLDLPLIILVENNHWSLATRIEERRKPILLNQLASSLGARYTALAGNDPVHYRDELLLIRERVRLRQAPEIVEVAVKTLGEWRLQSDVFPDGKLINYHAGAAPNVFFSDGPILALDASDPLYLIKERLGESEFACLLEPIRRSFLGFLKL